VGSIVDGVLLKHHDEGGDCFSQTSRNYPNPIQLQYLRDVTEHSQLNTMLQLFMHSLTEQHSVSVFQEVTGYSE
jgi:hypothetical protein